ncbi:hypothetical protein [Croceicoccus naphthovorans]|uniref:Uncharacterized protein n=1 Tax=Croceicoccus naphthovorans TaxID=1348774 RepID=A0A0G3XGW4_9SPHN|nr:hypothetical protein [Croceicoccus naphthovorans]AKM10775.1 hypothetical protein AB433_13670 [Croceicoccus naphthovorans]MBB3988975.1 hypothetical protein [Croceicoccus naphthovorans]
MRNLMMGIAAVALAASGAYAQPGNGNGNGNGKGNGNAAAAKGNGGGGQAKGNGNAKHNAGNPGNGGGKAPKVARSNPGNGGGNGNAKNNAPKRVVAQGNGNGNGNGNAKIRSVGNGNGNGNGKAVRVDYDDRRDGVRVRDRGDIFSFDRRNSIVRDYGLIDGCPPGLAKKNNGCNPPGLVKRDYYNYDRSGWWGLPGLIDGRYRYYDNNLVRLSPTGSILGYYPLLGGALAAGNVWPDWFAYEPVPTYYESFYGLGPRGYRYADNVLYRVDPETAAITSVAALLTGDSFTVGQPMPMGYDVYNVPYGYRDRYYDTPDAHYRYSDGYVYEIDPTTQLVAAAIELLI